MDFSIITPQILFDFFLRTAHVIAGIIWIGFLYWMVFINPSLQKTLSDSEKAKINPSLINPVMFYVRWAAKITFLTGFIYYISILHSEPLTQTYKPLLAWILIVGTSYALMYWSLTQNFIKTNGYYFAAVNTAIILIFSALLYFIYQKFNLILNSSYAIGWGGAMGSYILLNLFFVVAPAQKRVAGLIPLKENETLSEYQWRLLWIPRLNAVLSIPVMLLMAASSHLQFMRWGY